MILIWFCAFMGYFGTLYSSTTLSGDAHINFILSMLAGAPGNILYLFLPDKVGRKVTLFFGILTMGICCIGTGILSHYNNLLWLQITFSMIGRLVMTLNVKCCYLFTAELFPTSIRNSSVGIGSLFGGLGAIVGFLLEMLRSIWKPLPVLIIGSFCSFASILVLFLPETKEQKFPETIEDVL